MDSEQAFPPYNVWNCALLENRNAKERRCQLQYEHNQKHKGQMTEYETEQWYEGFRILMSASKYQLLQMTTKVQEPNLPGIGKFAEEFLLYKMSTWFLDSLWFLKWSAHNKNDQPWQSFWNSSSVGRKERIQELRGREGNILLEYLESLWKMLQWRLWEGHSAQKMLCVVHRLPHSQNFCSLFRR